MTDISEKDYGGQAALDQVRALFGLFDVVYNGAAVMEHQWNSAQSARDTEAMLEAYWQSANQMAGTISEMRSGIDKLKQLESKG